MIRGQHHRNYKLRFKLPPTLPDIDRYVHVHALDIVFAHVYTPTLVRVVSYTSCLEMGVGDAHHALAASSELT